MASLAELRAGSGGDSGGGGSSWLPKFGLGHVASQLKGFLPGLVHLGTSFVPGGTPAGEPWAQFGRGATNSLLQTGGRILTAAPELVTLGKSNFGDSELKKAAKFLAGKDEATQQSFQDQVGWSAYRKQGILPMALSDVGNAAIVGGAAAKAAKIGEVGAAASAGLSAETAAKAGYTAEDIANAAEKVPGINERMLSKVPMARRLSDNALQYHEIPSALREAATAAVKAPEAGAVDEAAVASRTKFLKMAENVAHPYKAAYSELLRPLGRAAQEAVAPVAEAAPDIMEQAQKDRALTQELDAREHIADQTGDRAEIERIQAARQSMDERLGNLKTAVKPSETEAVSEAIPTDANAPRVGPAQRAAERLRTQDVPDWARSAVGRAPEPVKNALSAIEGRVNAHEYAAVTKEQQRFVQAERRKQVIGPSGPVQASAKAAKMLRGRTLADGTKITAKQALDMVGGEIYAHIEGRSGMAAAIKERLPEDMHALVDEHFHLGDTIPKELMTDELQKALDTARGKWESLQDESLANFRGGRQGERGLDQVGSEEPAMTPGQTRKQNQINKDRKALSGIEKARDKEFIRTQKRVTEAVTKIKRLGAESERLGTMRDDVSELLDSLAERGFPLEDIQNMTPREIAERLPKVPGETEHAAMRRAYQMGRALEKAQALDERQTQVIRNLATIKRAKDDLLSKMTEGRLDNDILLQKRTQGVEARQARLSKALSQPSVRNVPTAYKPVWGAIESLSKEAKNNTVLAEALGGMGENFGKVVDELKAQGTDVNRLASLTDRDVRKMLFDPVKLSEKNREGKTILSGQRKGRIGAQTRQHTIEALAAAHVGSVIEPAANEVISFMEKNLAKDVPEGWTLKDMEDHGFIPWDAERNFILTGSKPEVNPNALPKSMVPRAVGTAIKHMSADYSHSIWGMPGKVTNAWRAAVLSWSPRWYFNNVLGNVTLATTGGVRLDDWLAALHSVRTGKEGSTVNEALDHFITKRRRGYMPESVAPEGTEGVGGMSLYSDLDRKPSLMGEADTVKGTYRAVKEQTGSRLKAFGAAYSESARKVQRANEVVDDLARSAVYLSKRRKGFNAEEALTAAHQALVDYNDLSPFERQVVRSVVPFYAWQKGMLKVVSKFPVDHPIAASMAMQIGKLNNDLFNPGIPDNYKQVIGGVNTRGLNPFQDAVDLMTPQGLIQGINPFVDIAVRNAYGAPDNGYAEQERINDFGQAVPDTSPLSDLLGTVTGLPQYQVGTGVSGAGTYPNQKTGIRALGGFVGVPTYTDADMQRFKDRLTKSQKKVKSFYKSKG